MTVLMATIANWFHRKMGMASGIAICGFGLSGLMIQLIVRITDAYDWRVTMTVLAIGMFVVILPLSFLFRHRPEQYGYLPDGETRKAAASDDGRIQPHIAEPSITTKEALRSSTFWRIALTYVCFSLLLSATMTHIMPYLSSVGISRSTASTAATSMTLISIGGRLGLAWLGDKRQRRLIVAATFAMMGTGMLIFAYTSGANTWMVVPFLAVFATGYGGCNALRPSLIREYFGRSNFGTVFGLLTGIAMIGNISGAPIAGWVYDNWNSYHNIWLIFAAVPIVAVIAMLTLSPVTTAPQAVDKT